MKWADKLVGVVVIAVVFFAATAITRSCWSGPTSAASDSSATHLDVARDRDAVVQDSLQSLIDAQADTLRRMHQRVARVLRVNDSLRTATPPPPDDSAVGALAYWRDRALKAEARNETLAIELVSLKDQGELTMAATAQLHAKQLASKDSVLTAAEAHITNLTADLNAARCYYLKPLVPCLPRKVETVAVVVTTAYITYRLTNRN